METWQTFLGDQTPLNIKIDQGGLRAWGFKTFKLSQLITFAGRHQTSLRVFSPYIVLAKPKMNVKGMNDDACNDDDDEDEEQDDDGWPTLSLVVIFLSFSFFFCSDFFYLEFYKSPRSKFIKVFSIASRKK